jgi:polygalacturonase
MQSEKGIIAQYAKNMLFDNVRIETPSLTPVQFDKCNYVVINGMQIINPDKNSKLFELKECMDIKISDCFFTDSFDTFLNYDEKCENIYLTNKYNN